jgi:hypothetical protein
VYADNALVFAQVDGQNVLDAAERRVFMGASSSWDDEET